MKIIPLITLTALLLSPVMAAEREFMEFRTFTNQDGKELEARLLYIKDSKIEIERRDGQIFLLAVSLLSDHDQEWLKEHLPAIQEAMTKPLFEFTGIEAEKSVSDHFKIYTINTSEEPAKPYAERTWEASAKFLPQLKDDFENGKFSAPGKFRNQNDFDADGRFRFSIYLLNAEQPYEMMLAQHVERIEDPVRRASELRLSREVGHFDDDETRYLVATKTATETSAKGGSEAAMVHKIARRLLENQCQNVQLPFWFSAGFGWFMENDIFKSCRTRYIALERTDRELGGVGNIRATQGFDPDEPWARELKRLHRAGEKVSIREVLNAGIRTMSPEVSGSVFSFVYFLIGTETNRNKFGQLVTKLRQGENLTQELLLRTYGFESLEAMEEAWYAFIPTTDFR